MLALTIRSCGNVAPTVVRSLFVSCKSLSDKNVGLVRSVQEAPMPDMPIQRSVDAPLDPYDKRHRDTRGMSEEEVEASVRDNVANAGARASEASSGRADMLRANPSFHMNQAEHDEALVRKKFGDWETSVVGDGVQETIKTGTGKAKEALKKMFNPNASSTTSERGSGHTDQQHVPGTSQQHHSPPSHHHQHGLGDAGSEGPAAR